MDEKLLSHAADLIIVSAGCAVVCLVIGGIVAQGLLLLVDSVKLWCKKRREKKDDQDAVSGS